MFKTYDRNLVYLITKKKKQSVGIKYSWEYTFIIYYSSEVGVENVFFFSAYIIK